MDMKRLIDKKYIIMDKLEKKSTEINELQVYEAPQMEIIEMELEGVIANSLNSMSSNGGYGYGFRLPENRL